MVTTDNPKSYFDKARRFDQDRLMQIERSNRIAWSIAIASGIVASVSVFAIAGLTPLKTVEPFVVRVDNSTGIVDVVSALTATVSTYDEAVTKYFAAKYVRAREVMSGARHKKTSARSPFYRPNRNRRASQPCIGAATRNRLKTSTAELPRRGSISRRSPSSIRMLSPCATCAPRPAGRKFAPPIGLRP